MAADQSNMVRSGKHSPTVSVAFHADRMRQGSILELKKFHAIQHIDEPNGHLTY
jgi:hypothetical protein